MKNNKKFWILFAIIIALSVGTQLVAQDSTETKDCCVVPPIKNKKEVKNNFTAECTQPPQQRCSRLQDKIYYSHNLQQK